MARLSLFPQLILISVLVAASSACKPAGPAGTGRGGMPPVQVVAIPVARQQVVEKLALVGTLAANEIVEVKSEIEGTVESIGFQEGQPVRKGDLLVQLDATKLKASLDEAEASFKLSQTTYTRNEELLRSKLVSQQEYDQAAAIYHQSQATVELRRRLLKDTRIFAPFDGVTTARLISPGQVISRNSPLTSIVDLDPVKAEISVPERFLGQLKIGQTIELKVAAIPGKIFKGSVFFVAPYVDPSTRTALVKAGIPNASAELKPGMFANLELTLSLRDSAIVVPEVALAQILEEDRAVVYVVGKDETVQIRPVKLGVRMPGTVEIIEGLNDGERVIVEGVQKVGMGSKVSMAPAASQEPYLNKPKAPGA